MEKKIKYYRLTDWIITGEEDFKVIASWATHFKSLNKRYAVYEKNDYSVGRKKSQAVFIVGHELGIKDSIYREGRERIFNSYRLVEGLDMILLTEQG